MKKIQFLKDTSKAILTNIPDNSILVYYDGYNIPNINIPKIEFQEYKATFQNYSPELIILVGINRMITPSNRCDRINDFLQILSLDINKISIDTAPFIGEPWRFWFHYSVVFSRFMEVNYSYPIEGEWQKWFYRQRNTSRLEASNLNLYIKDTSSELNILDTSFMFFEPNEIQKEYYLEVKKFVFEKYNTPKLLINNLLKLLNKFFQIDLKHDSYISNKIKHVPNLGIYRFIVEENIRRMNIYNLFTNENLRQK